MKKDGRSRRSTKPRPAWEHPTNMTEVYTRVFRGRTETDIETKFLQWHRDNVARVTNIKKYPIDPLPQKMQSQSLRERMPISNGFQMKIEYEKVSRQKR
jgi:hypothetical protein